MDTIKILLNVILFLMFISCNHDNSKSSKPDIASSIINHKISDTIYKDRDSLIIKSKISTDTLIRFVSKINDSKYFIKPENSARNKNPDFSNYEFKKMFVTNIKEGMKEQGVNFAGHFCFVYWGCGSPCKLSAVVDMHTGKVYNGINSEIGYEFKKNSSVLIVNPPDSTGFYNKNIFWQKPTQYIWNGKKFEILQ